MPPVSLTVEQERRHTLAQELGRIAGTLTLARYQDEALRIDTKLDRTLVTEADREAERTMRARIADAFPGDGIVGEEYGSQAGSSGWSWYLDPIDGTQAYARGVPLFGTLIGVTHQGDSRVGVIFLPALGECVHAAKDRGCHWESALHPLPGRAPGDGAWSEPRRRRARVSTVSALADATFCATAWMQSFDATARRPLFAELCDATAVFRGWGDCFGYALVATGRVDVMVDPQLAPWDAGPMPVILDEAGGRYTSFQGSRDLHAGDGVGSNGLLHDAVLRLINGR